MFLGDGILWCLSVVMYAGVIDPLGVIDCLVGVHDSAAASRHAGMQPDRLPASVLVSTALRRWCLTQLGPCCTIGSLIDDSLTECQMLSLCCQQAPAGSPPDVSAQLLRACDMAADHQQQP